MKAQELRIGNLILVNDKQVEVENMSEYGINGNSWSDTHYGNTTGGFDWDYELKKDRIEGIPLTEEWLIKFGFIKGVEYQSFRGPYYFVSKEKEPIGNVKYTELSGNYFIKDSLFDFRYGCHFTEIKYVHHLQNLYFSLTGTELEVAQKTI